MKHYALKLPSQASGQKSEIRKTFCKSQCIFVKYPNFRTTMQLSLKVCEDYQSIQLQSLENQ